MMFVIAFPFAKVRALYTFRRFEEVARGTAAFPAMCVRFPFIPFRFFNPRRKAGQLDFPIVGNRVFCAVQNRHLFKHDLNVRDFFRDVFGGVPPP